MAKQFYFGGSFYPPHRAHREVIHQALSRERDAILHIVPTKQNPLKESPGASLELIEAWMEDLAAEISYQEFSRCQLDLRELTSASPKSYTIETLEALQRESLARAIVDEWVLLLGSDSALSLARWKEPRKLLSAVEQVWVVPRKALSGEESLPTEAIIVAIKNIFRDLGGESKLLLLEPVSDISSTRLRNEATSQQSHEFLSPHVFKVWKKILTAGHTQ